MRTLRPIAYCTSRARSDPERRLSRPAGLQSRIANSSAAQHFTEWSARQFQLSPIFSRSTIRISPAAGFRAPAGAFWRLSAIQSKRTHRERALAGSCGGFGTRSLPGSRGQSNPAKPGPLLEVESCPQNRAPNRARYMPFANPGLFLAVVALPAILGLQSRDDGPWRIIWPKR